MAKIFACNNSFDGQTKTEKWSYSILAAKLISLIGRNIFWRNYLDSPSASTCCTVLDLILDYIFEKLYPSSNSLKTTKEPEGNAWQLALEKNPDILLNVLWNYVNLKKFYLQLLSTLLNQILFEGNV